MMMPIASINADILYQVWNNVVSFSLYNSFDIAVTMTDGHSANVSLFNKKILKNPGDLFIPNEKSPGSKIFPFFDTSHLF